MSSVGRVEKFIEPTLIQPTFVTHLPKESIRNVILCPQLKPK
jgi:lysyl-tRNA synthetase class II